MRDIDLVDNILNEVDTLIHLACISNDPSYELNPKLGEDINFKSFPKLINISKKHNIDQFIYASSSEVYGEPVEIPQRENTTPLNSKLPYAVVKNLAESYFRAFQNCRIPRYWWGCPCGKYCRA